MSDRAVAWPPFWHRYRWTKRILLALSVLLVALGGVRWWWGAEAQRRYDEYVAEVHAQGGQILVTDFVRPPDKDAENSAVLLQVAARDATLVMRPPLAPEDVAIDPLLALEFPAQADQLLDASCSALETTREALIREQTDWGVRLTSPMFALLLPPLANQRNLARVLSGAAAIQAMRGQAAESLSSLRLCVELSHRVSEPPSFLISWLISVAIRGQACMTIERIAPRLEPGALARGTPARREAEGLLAELLDESRATAAAKGAVEMERASFLDATNVVIAAPSTLRGFSFQLAVPEVLFRTAFTPALRLDGVRGARILGGMEAALDQPTWPAAEARMPRWQPRQGKFAEYVADLLSNLLLPAINNALERQYSDRFTCRAAATALAIRLYEADHGARPAALADLAPDYLPAVPLDPFTPGSAPLRYDSDPGVARVYSIRGAEKEAPPGGLQWNRYEFLLDAEIRRPPPPRGLLPREPEEESLP